MTECKLYMNYHWIFSYKVSNFVWTRNSRWSPLQSLV